MRNVLVLVTSDPALAREMAPALGAEGFAVEVRSDPGAGGLPGPCPVVVLDLDVLLPRWAALEAVRSGPAGPKAVVAALASHRDPTQDLVRAFHAGLDDYVLKPVEPRVLAARLQALVRLRGRARPASASALRTQDGRLRLDGAAHRCWLGDRGGGREVPLTPKEFEVLAYLLSRRNRLVTRDELLGGLWTGTALEENTRTLVQHVLHLRRKLGNVGGRLETVRGLGYRFRDR